MTREDMTTITKKKAEEVIKTLWRFRSFYDSDIREIRSRVSTSASEWHDSLTTELQSLRASHPLSLRIGFLEQNLESIEAVGELADRLTIGAIYIRFETRIKSLIETGVPNAAGCTRFTWPKIVACLEGIGIHPTTLCGYREITELRLINNAIKHHCGRISKELSPFGYSVSAPIPDLSQSFERFIAGCDAFVNVLVEQVVRFHDPTGHIVGEIERGWRELFSPIEL